MENSVLPFELESIVNQIEVGKCKFVMSMVFLNTGDLLKVSQFLIKAMVLKTLFFLFGSIFFLCCSAPCSSFLKHSLQNGQVHFQQFSLYHVSL